MDFFAFLGRNVRWLAGGFLLAFFSSYGQTFFISLSGNDIRSEFGLTHGDFGLIYMFATLASAASLPIVGVLADRMAIAKLASGVIVVLACATFMMASAKSVIVLGVTIYLLRLMGQGMMTHTAMTAMGKWYSAHRGRAVAIASTGQQTGDAIFPIIVVSLFAAIGWRQGWMVAGGTMLLVALPAIYFLMRVERIPRNQITADEAHRSIHDSKREWTRGEMARDPLFWMLLFGILAPGFIGTTIFFHPQYLVEQRGWNMQSYALSYVLMASTTICVGLITGVLIDRFSAKRVMPFFLPPLAMSCFVLGNFPHYWAMFAFMILLGVSYGFYSTLFGSMWAEFYGRRNLGANRSFVAALAVFSTALGPGLTGWLIDQNISYFFQINVMGCWCVIGFIVLLVVSKRTLARNAAT